MKRLVASGDVSWLLSAFLAIPKKLNLFTGTSKPSVNKLKCNKIFHKNIHIKINMAWDQGCSQDFRNTDVMSPKPCQVILLFYQILKPCFFPETVKFKYVKFEKKSHSAFKTHHM